MAELAGEQVNRYLDMARDHGFDAVVTISNQITSGHDDCPVAVDGRKTRKVRLYHLSWWRIVTEAVMQHRFRGISDPDQADFGRADRVSRSRESRRRGLPGHGKAMGARS